MTPIWAQAYFWGLVIGSGLVLGALSAYFLMIPHKAVASVMGFGGGVLISVISFELMEEAYLHGGLVPAIAGFLCGGIVFCTANWYLSKRGAKHRKRCGACVAQPSEEEMGGSGMAIAIGATIDQIPEAIAVGLSLIGGAAIDKMLVIGFFLANFPQGLSSASGMKEAGRSAKYIFGVWFSIVIISGFSALLGYSVVSRFSPQAISATTAFAAGGLLAMLAETMIPEAFEKVHNFIGLITVAGFLVFFIMVKLA
jgi:ZIP family zinc transporter